MPGPPVEQGIGPDLIGIIAEDAAAFRQGLVEIVEGLEMGVGESFVGQRPQMLGGLQFRQVCRQKHQLNAIGDLKIVGDVGAGTVQPSKRPILAFAKPYH